MTTKVNLSSGAGVSGVLSKANGGTGTTFGASLVPVVIAGTSQTATAPNHYYTGNAGATALTLPASASEGDYVYFTTTNSRTDNTILRNGLTIMGAANDLNLDIANITICLMYINSSWRII